MDACTHSRKHKQTAKRFLLHFHEETFFYETWWTLFHPQKLSFYRNTSDTFETARSLALWNVRARYFTTWTNITRTICMERHHCIDEKLCSVSLHSHMIGVGTAALFIYIWSPRVKRGYKDNGDEYGCEQVQTLCLNTLWQSFYSVSNNRG